MSKQATPNPYAIKTVVTGTGERLPMLCRSATGEPLFAPAIWALTELRATNRSTSTIQQALRGVMVLLLTLDNLGIDLAHRLQEGRLLSLGEIDAIAGTCKLPLADFWERLRIQNECASVSRLVRRKALPPVEKLTAGIRLRYIRDYLDWLATDHLLRIGPKHEAFAELQGVAKTALNALSARIPPSSGRNVVDLREGLPPALRDRLIEIVDPESPENPWPSNHTRVRNYLVVRWLLSTGIRRGELLGLKISDINFASNEVLIRRRADDPEDPRAYQPNAKTRDRLLAIDADLAALTREYVMRHRRAVAGTKRHEFLWVANGTGAPLSGQGLNKMFVQLQRKFPEFPEGLSPHVLRHTWNEWFSEQMDRTNVPDAMEQKMRSRQMGWSDNSKMAATYLRRRIRVKANEASLEMQRKLRKGNTEGRNNT